VRSSLLLVLVIGLGACAPRGGHHVASSPAGGATTAPASAAHWRAALTALGTSYSPAPISLDDAGLQRASALLAQSWPTLRAWIDRILEARLRRQLATLPPGVVSRLTVKRLAIDTAAAPAFVSEAGGAGIRLEAPAAPGAWTVEIDAEIDVMTQVRIFGINTWVGTTLDLSVAARDIRGDARIDFDLRDPARPEPVQVHAPHLDLRLDLSSTSPVLAQIAPTVAQILDPIIRRALFLGAADAQQSIAGFLARVPRTPHGLGGAPLGSVTPAPDLGALADRISEEIQRDHLPFETLVGVRYSLPGYGNGVPVRYVDTGDSALWTGHYLAAEAMPPE
jgi:hypothetical protein